MIFETTIAVMEEKQEPRKKLISPSTQEITTSLSQPASLLKKWGTARFFGYSGTFPRL
jgi:hypothetical protein